MNKIRNFFLVFLFSFCVMNPQWVVSEETHDHTYFVSLNIKQIGDYLKKQDYFLNVVKLCHEEDCFRIDIHDLDRSLKGVEEKILAQIKKEKGEEEALTTKLKGFAITRIITR